MDRGGGTLTKHGGGGGVGAGGGGRRRCEVSFVIVMVKLSNPPPCNPLSLRGTSVAGSHGTEFLLCSVLTVSLSQYIINKLLL